MVLLYIVGVGASFQLGRLILRGACRHRRGLTRKRMFSPAKTYASEPPARQAPMIHGIQLGSGSSSVRFGGFASFGEADVPPLSAGGRYDSLAA